MAIQLLEHTNVSDGALASRTTKLSNNAKIAHALFTGIVKNKVGYAVREYAKNAWEVSPAGKPFQVDLPTRWSPRFRVRDFGTGLSHHFMMYKYPQLGESTKDSGGIGGISGWGFGSKSALAYLMEDGLSGSYTVISYRDLIASHYIISLDSTGMPEVKHFMDIPTEEPNGLEVSFAVRDEDFRTFEQNAREILWSFEPRPVVSPDLKFKDPKVLAKGAGWTSFRPESVPFVGPQVRVGPVMYPIDMDQIEGSVGFLLPTDCIIFDVADKAVSPTASREELQYTSGTKRSLSEMIQVYEQNYISSVQTKVDAAKSYFEGAAICASETQHLGVNRAAGVRSKIKWGGQPVRVGIDAKTMHLSKSWSSFERFRHSDINPASIPHSKVVIEHGPYASLDRFIALDLVGQDVLWARVKKDELPGFLEMCALKEDDVTILDSAPLKKRPSFQVGTRANQVRRRRVMTIAMPSAPGARYGVTISEGVETVDLAEPGIMLSKMAYYGRKKDSYNLGDAYSTIREGSMQEIAQGLYNLGLIKTDTRVLIDTGVDDLDPGWTEFGRWVEDTLAPVLDVKKLTPIDQQGKPSDIHHSARVFAAADLLGAPADMLDFVDKYKAVDAQLRAQADRVENANDKAFRVLMMVKSGLAFPISPKGQNPADEVNEQYERLMSKYPLYKVIMNSSGYGGYNAHSERMKLIKNYFALLSNQK